MIICGRVYNGGFIPDILLLTQAPILVRWFDGDIILLLPSYTTVSSVLKEK